MRGFERWLTAVLLAMATCGQALAYERLSPGTWFLRVQNPPDATQRLCVRVYFNPNREPWNGDTIYIAAPGESTRPPPAADGSRGPGPHPPFMKKAPPVSEWLDPGQASPWVDIGPYMSRSPQFGVRDYLSPVLLGAMYAAGRSGLVDAELDAVAGNNRSKPAEPKPMAGNRLRLIAELATGPDKQVQRKLEVDDSNATKLGASTWLGRDPLPTLALLVPVKPAGGQRIWTAEEAAQQQLDWVKSYGAPPTPPREMLFLCGQWQVAFRNPTKLQALNTEILRRLGYNNLTQFAKDAADIEAIRSSGWEPIPGTEMRTWHAEKQIAELKEKGLWKWFKVVSFGDEIEITPHGKPEEQDAAFVADLRARGFQARDFIRPADETNAAALSDEEQWQLVRLGGPLPPERPKLFFEAATFRYRMATRQMAERTASIRTNFPPGIQTGANYSPHLSVWPDVRKWINVFRDGGMTMPWSEDWWWQVPEASPQSYGFLLDALRHAADYHQAPYCFYTIPNANYHEGSDIGSHLLRMNYFALGHQAKIINHFNIFNQIFGTCDFIDFLESEAKYRVLHRVLNDVGRIDGRLYAARLRPAEAGILLSIANDVWNNDTLLAKDPPVERLYSATLNVDNHERKALWLALRHAHVPVDLLTDEDATSRIPSRFKVLYVVGNEILGQAVKPLRRWVEAGGTLVAIGGGGVLNQYREKQSAVLDLYGLSDQTVEPGKRSLRPANDLPKMESVDLLTFDAAHGGLQLPAFCGVRRLTPAAGTPVVATFRDGTPAAIDRKVGKGRVLVIGALPGLAYLQPGIGGRRHGMTLDYPDAVRRRIVEPAETAKVQRHVTTSDPLVEATLQEGKLGAVVTLISFRVIPDSWTPPTEKLTVTLSGLPHARKVTSLRHGELEVKPTDQGPQVSLPVDQGDFLVVD